MYYFGNPPAPICSCGATSWLAAGCDCYVRRKPWQAKRHRGLQADARGAHRVFCPDYKARTMHTGRTAAPPDGQVVESASAPVPDFQTRFRSPRGGRHHEQMNLTLRFSDAADATSSEYRCEVWIDGERYAPPQRRQPPVRPSPLRMTTPLPRMTCDHGADRTARSRGTSALGCRPQAETRGSLPGMCGLS